MVKRGKGAFMISVVAQSYNIHPQTLRLYERAGLLKPSRTEGNTRLYTEEDVARLEVILNLTRDMGVNLAGVEIILNMREKMEQMHQQIAEFVGLVQSEMTGRKPVSPEIRNALVRFSPAIPVRVHKKET
jgi:MerR family transcriptional regulator/heat shock protein HspR